MVLPDFLSGMADKTKPVVSLIQGVMQGISQPMRAKLLLVINHVVAQEAEATRRLKGCAGRKVVLEHVLGQWLLVITPAGLFEEVDSINDENGAIEEVQGIDLRIRVQSSDFLKQVGLLFKGERLPVVIEGDADFAAVFAWLGENLRWDYEEDFSRIVGDVPAHVAVEQLHLTIGFFKGVLESVDREIDRSGK